MKHSILIILALILSSEVLMANSNFESNPNGYRHGMSLDVSAFFSRTATTTNMAMYTMIWPAKPIYEGGIGIGAHYQFLTNHSIGLDFGAGAGGHPSMILLSHFCFSTNYVYGNKVDSWALGPFFSVELAEYPIVVGAMVFYKNWFTKLGVSAGIHAGYHINAGYSFYFGK